MSGVGTGTTQRTILFTDLVGFTEFNELSGDALAVRVLDAQTELVRGALVRTDGSRVVKELGDGLLLSFDRPTDGYAASCALLETYRRAHDAGDFPLQVRMGLHHGEVAERGDDLVGRTVNLASRVMSLAGPGELLVSDDVARRCPGAALRPIGPTRLRGVPDPVWLHRALVPERQPPLAAGS